MSWGERRLGEKVRREGEDTSEDKGESFEEGKKRVDLKGNRPKIVVGRGVGG